MSYGNDNVASYNRHQYITFDGTSDTSALSGQCKAISIYATAACWVKVGRGTQTAVKAGGEKTAGETFFVPATTWISAIRTSGSDEAPWYVGVIQDSGGGNLHVYEHHDF